MPQQRGHRRNHQEPELDYHGAAVLPRSNTSVTSVSMHRSFNEVIIITIRCLESYNLHTSRFRRLKSTLFTRFSLLNTININSSSTKRTRHTMLILGFKRIQSIMNFNTRNQTRKNGTLKDGRNFQTRHTNRQSRSRSIRQIYSKLHTFSRIITRQLTKANHIMRTRRRQIRLVTKECTIRNRANRSR